MVSVTVAVIVLIHTGVVSGVSVVEVLGCLMGVVSVGVSASHWVTLTIEV